MHVVRLFAVSVFVAPATGSLLLEDGCTILPGRLLKLILEIQVPGEEEHALQWSHAFLRGIQYLWIVFISFPDHITTSAGHFIWYTLVVPSWTLLYHLNCLHEMQQAAMFTLCQPPKRLDRDVVTVEAVSEYNKLVVMFKKTSLLWHGAVSYCH